MGEGKRKEIGEEDFREEEEEGVRGKGGVNGRVW